MPIVIPRDLPAFDSLLHEKIFVMDGSRAVSQDIRPIEIAILNLMPTKEVTETQLLRLLGNTPLQVNVTLVKTSTYKANHTSETYLDKFYKNLDEIKKMKFDGMIITGAPVETLPFTDVKYWAELQEILDFADENVTSTMFICWGAQAALYYYYGINKHLLDKKLFGVYNNVKCVLHEPLLKGMDDAIMIPHSRHTAIDEDKLKKCPDLEVLVSGEKCGPGSRSGRPARSRLLCRHVVSADYAENHSSAGDAHRVPAAFQLSDRHGKRYFPCRKYHRNGDVYGNAADCSAHP